MDAMKMSIDRQMHKAVVHMQNRILLSHTKEQNYTICREVDGPRDSYTESSQSKREIIIY